MTPTPKPFYLSKTVALNVVVTLIGILALASKTVPAEYEPWVILATGVLNIILRVWFVDTAIAK